MNLNLHSLFRYYVPGAVFIFISLIINKYFHGYFDFIGIFNVSSNRFIIGTTALPLVIGFILSWIWRGLHMQFLYKFTGNNDYINSRVNELEKVLNMNARKRNLITLRSIFDFVLFGEKLKDDTFNLHRDRIKFQLSDLHCVDATIFGLMIIYVLLILSFYNFLCFKFPIIIISVFLFLILFCFFMICLQFILCLFYIFTGIFIFNFLWLIHNFYKFFLGQFLILIFIPFLIIFIYIYRRVINNSLVEYEKILINRNSFKGKIKEFRNYYNLKLSKNE